MSDTWANTRASIAKLKRTWSEADEETRWDFRFWIGGQFMMATAIIIQFGSVGLLFCAGFLIWVSANNALRS